MLLADAERECIHARCHLSEYKADLWDAGKDDGGIDGVLGWSAIQGV